MQHAIATYAIVLEFLDHHKKFYSREGKQAFEDQLAVIAQTFEEDDFNLIKENEDKQEWGSYEDSRRLSYKLVRETEKNFSIYHYLEFFFF